MIQCARLHKGRYSMLRRNSMRLTLTVATDLEKCAMGATVETPLDVMGGHFG